MKNANDRACPEQFKVHSADNGAGCDARTDGDDDNHGSVELFAVVVVVPTASYASIGRFRDGCLRPCWFTLKYG